MSTTIQRNAIKIHSSIDIISLKEFLQNFYNSIKCSRVKGVKVGKSCRNCLRKILRQIMPLRKEANS